MQLIWNMSPSEVAKFRALDPHKERSEGILNSGCPWKSNPEDWAKDSQNFIVIECTSGYPLPSSTSTDREHYDAEIEERTGTRMFLGTNFLFGLAPQSAREGDLICHFWRTDATAVMRRVRDTNVFYVAGRLHLHVKDLSSSWNEPPLGADALVIHMDIRTLSMLTC